MAMRYPLPYAFARSNALLLEDDGHAMLLWHNANPDLDAMGEIMRRYGSGSSALVLQRADPGTLAQRISAAYAEGESSAAAVVSEVESDADLSRMMQELPAVEDLLETSDDAPIIRMLNALLTQAARDVPATSISNPTSGIRACAFGWTEPCARSFSPIEPCMPR